MHAEILPVLITSRALIGALVVLIGFLAFSAITSAARNGAGKRPDLRGALFGGAIIFAIPLGIAAFVGFAASGLLVAASAPPPTYIFLLLVALMTFRAALNHPSAGMEGCTKMFGLVWSGYAIIWSLVAFGATGGPRMLQTGTFDPRWLQPPVAALPFALIVLRLADKKGNVWLFLGTMAFVSAAMALSFFPVENGVARALLPASDWLRFPLFGLAIAAVLAIPRLILHLRLKPEIRRVRRRNLNSGLLFLAAIMAAFGLAWAATRTLIEALA